LITELHTVALYVADQDRAKQFYVETCTPNWRPRAYRWPSPRRSVSARSSTSPILTGTAFASSTRTEEPFPIGQGRRSSDAAAVGARAPPFRGWSEGYSW